MFEDIAQAPVKGQACVTAAAELVKRGLEALFSGTREAEALDCLRAAAESGDSQGQYVTGMLYYLGKGARKDLAEAVRWLTRAAQQGYADAQYELAERYSLGEGTAQDPAEAARWYAKAAAQQHLPARLALSQGLRAGAAAPPAA